MIIASLKKDDNLPLFTSAFSVLSSSTFPMERWYHWDHFQSCQLQRCGNHPIRQAYGWGLRAFFKLRFQIQAAKLCRGASATLVPHHNASQHHQEAWAGACSFPGWRFMARAGHKIAELHIWRLSFRLLNLKVLGILWERWDLPAWKITAEAQLQAAGWPGRGLDVKQSLQVGQGAFILRHASSPQAEQCRSHSPCRQARKDPLALQIYFYTAPAKTAV